MILPRPDDDFEWVDAAGRPALVCRPLERLARHIFTTKSWSLGSSSRAGADAWDEIAHAIDADRLFRVHQIHGAEFVVHRVTRPAAALADADIIVSDDGETAIAIQSADCVPLLMADTRIGAVAAAHAGWRGTARRVAAVAVHALTSALGSRPEDLVVAIGPSIGACCYQVGNEVRDRLRAEGFSEADVARWFLPSARPSPDNPSMPGLSAMAQPGRWYFDLWSATRDQLEKSGVRPDQIFGAQLCTASHAAFCSYRRDGARTGRLAAAIRAGRS
jgi:YfiH family protein